MRQKKKRKLFLTRRFERDPCRVHVVLPPVDVLHGLDGGLAPPAHLDLVGGGVVGVAPRDQPQRAEAGEEKTVCSKPLSKMQSAEKVAKKARFFFASKRDFSLKGKKGFFIVLQKNTYLCTDSAALTLCLSLMRFSLAAETSGCSGKSGESEKMSELPSQNLKLFLRFSLNLFQRYQGLSMSAPTPKPGDPAQFRFRSTPRQGFCEM